MTNQTVYIIVESDLEGDRLQFSLGYFVDKAKAQAIANQLWLSNKSSCCHGFWVQALQPAG